MKFLSPVLAFAIGIPALAQTLPTGSGPAAASQLVNLRHWTGQSVAPVYEGFDVNPDGSYNMWFGYMNRNYEEEVDIPVGPDNRFEPGGDRGQPTHFVPRRHKDYFKVTVPKEFGDNKLVWMLTVHGRTAQDFFKGHADWDRIAAIKPHLARLPLIGNGDLNSLSLDRGI